MNLNPTSEYTPEIKPLLTPSEMRRRRPTFIDVDVPDLGRLRLHRLRLEDVLEMQSQITDLYHDDETESGEATADMEELKEVLSAGIASSLGGAWSTQDGLETLAGLSHNEVFALSRIANAVSGLGTPIPVGVDPWQWAIDKVKTNTKEMQIGEGTDVNQTTDPPGEEASALPMEEAEASPLEDAPASPIEEALEAAKNA